MAGFALHRSHRVDAHRQKKRAQSQRRHATASPLYYQIPRTFWPPFAPIGASKTTLTGCLTSLSARMPARPAKPTPPAISPPCASSLCSSSSPLRPKSPSNPKSQKACSDNRFLLSCLRELPMPRPCGDTLSRFAGEGESCYAGSFGSTTLASRSKPSFSSTRRSMATAAELASRSGSAA